MLTLIKKVGGALIPLLSKEKSKIRSVDTLLSKRENVTKTEVILAMGYKIVRLLFIGYMAVSVIAGNVSLGEILQVLSLGI